MSMSYIGNIDGSSQDLMAMLNMTGSCGAVPVVIGLVRGQVA